MQYHCPPYGVNTTREYSLPAVRAFNRGVLSAFYRMRLNQKDAIVWLPKHLFPLQQFPECRPILKWSNDSTDRFVVCEDRRMYLRPVNARLMGVMDRDENQRIVHGGPWLSLPLVLTFTAG